MSRVTNIVLNVGHNDEPLVHEINVWLLNHGEKRVFRPVSGDDDEPQTAYHGRQQSAGG